ncbi:hypothetical protein Sjap_010182 [Stephania japonica]|uniref:A-kinase anchor protein 17A n=1 Tax=Stephania japonica TaxID=461633 RepID=A0AAP0J9X0_9MAGN
MSSSSSRPSLKSLPPTQTLEIESGLSLVPRVKLLLTIYRSDLSVKPIDEWLLKRSLIDFLKTSLPHSHLVPEEDLEIRRFKDLKKRKREDPVASGTLYIRDLGFVANRKDGLGNAGDEEEASRVLERRFFDWRDSFEKRLNGIELSLSGAKFRLDAVLPPCDDFEGLKRNWEEFYAFSGEGLSSRGGRQQPDTLILRGAPSRWFAEPRVSSKPSMLVTHTIFSVFGKIRNLFVTADDDASKNAEEGNEELVSGLHCKIVVQFEKYDDFYNALRVLCGRSMHKQGSRLRADYEVTWDKDGFFRSIQQRPARTPVQDRITRTQPMLGQYRNDTSRFQSHASRFGSYSAR